MLCAQTGIGKIIAAPNSGFPPRAGCLDGKHLILFHWAGDAEMDRCLRPMKVIIKHRRSGVAA
jgi:hypothetical protein